MINSIDLKPLTEETIQEMGFQGHDLWLVKIDSAIYGPFETESLKHYVSDNEELFNEAEASLSDETEWKSFWAYTKFQRRKPQGIPSENYEGPFWLMDVGRLSGPFAHRDIDKKIEMGILGMTDHLSIDSGESWIKIYEIHGFDRRSHSPDELPRAPVEASFQKAKLEIVDKLEQPHLNTINELAGLVWEEQLRGKVIRLKKEELSPVHLKSAAISSSFKWASPSAAAVFIGLLTTGYFLFFSDKEVTLVESSEQESVNRKNKISDSRVSSKGVVPSAGFRSPSSVGYTQPSKINEPTYQTHIETHAENYPDAVAERAPSDTSPAEAEQPPQEPSLVENNQQQEDQSLDAAMNTTPRSEEQPVVEEASDF